MYEWMYRSSPTSIVRTCKSSSLISLAGIGREGKGVGGGWADRERKEDGKKERECCVCANAEIKRVGNIKFILVTLYMYLSLLKCSICTSLSALCNFLLSLHQTLFSGTWYM